MIKISVPKIGRDGLLLEGDEQTSQMNLEYSDRCTPTDRLCYKLHVSLLGRDVLVAGYASLDFSCLCDRCNAQFVKRIENKNICRLYENVTEPEIDLTEDLREDILVSLPVKQLCKENCKGICSSCGTDLNKMRCSCSKTSNGVPLWEELDKINFNLKE